MKVLVVEDDNDMGRLVADLLVEDGHSVILTDALQEAIKATVPGRFDVVVLDLFLRDSQSLDTITAMKANAPYVPLVVITGMDVDEKAAIAAGAASLVSKGEVGFYPRLREALARAFGAAVFTPAKEKLDKIDKLTKKLFDKGETHEAV